MSRFLLDTTILSEYPKLEPSSRVLEWLDRQEVGNLFIASFTIAELKRGILQKAPGRRRRELESWFDSSEGPQMAFRGRVLSFDEDAALAWAKLMADGFTTGQPRSALDMIIAATAVSNNCVVATANEKHFRDVVDYVNPLREP